MKDVVVIVWNDAVLRTSLNDTDKVPHVPMLLQSAGFLIKSDKVGVSFATDFDPDDCTYREQSFIPRGMILSERVLSNRNDRVIRKPAKPKIK